MQKRFSARTVILFMIVISLTITIMVGYRFFYISTTSIIDGVDIKALKDNRNTLETILPANRGMICDEQNNTLAMSVNTYDITLNLSDKYSDATHIKHVVNKEETAQLLASALDAPYEYILEKLNPPRITYTLEEYLNTLDVESRNVELITDQNILDNLSYEITQVELGIYGKNLTEIKKKEIEDLNIKGLDFRATQNRFYKNGVYASHIIGYAQNVDDNVVGQMGIELEMDDKLKGIPGYQKIQVDSLGNKIPNTPTEIKYPKNGVDVCLTLDRKIQETIEASLKSFSTEYSTDWSLAVVMDAKTGAILGGSQTPTFDPNVKDIQNYLNMLVSVPYEPGSVMKTITYAAAINEGVYDGNTTFPTGELKVGPDLIVDYNHADGWGKSLTYDQGFVRSSNVGIAHILRDNLSEVKFKEYLNKFGFGKTTDSQMNGEVGGKVTYNTVLEQYNAGFGQGILTTPLQIMQAYTAFANDGDIVKPYLISSYGDVDNNRTYYQNERTVIAKDVLSSETVNKMKDLLKGVVSSEILTSKPYEMEGVDLIGKTGTAQYLDPLTNQYTTANQKSIVSFVGMYPKDDPQFIVYTASKDVNAPYTSLAMSNLVKDVINGTKDYNKTANSSQFIESNGEFRDFRGTLRVDAENYLHSSEQNYIILGDGQEIIDYAPKKIELEKNDLLVLNAGGNVLMPDLNRWSKKNVLKFAEAANIKVVFEGSGYVIGQSIEVNTLLENQELIINLGP